MEINPKNADTPEMEIAPPTVGLGSLPIPEPEFDDGKKTLSLRFSREFHAALEHLSTQTQLNKTQLLEISVAMFYRNFFEKEFAQIPDIALFLDELGTLTTEHTEEVANLAEIGINLIDAEAELPTDVEKS
jgi:hypothetical protein